MQLLPPSLQDPRRQRLALAGAMVLLAFALLTWLIWRMGDSEPEVETTVRSLVVADPAPVTLLPLRATDDAEVAVDGDSITVLAEPDSGDVRVNEDGTITYAARPEFDGRDRFTYRVEDGSRHIEVTVNVEALATLSGDLDALDFRETCVWCLETGSIELGPGFVSVIVQSAVVEGDDADQFALEETCEGVVLGAERDSCAIEVSFEPTHPGVASARLRIEHSGEGGSLSIPLTGEGVCERPNDRSDLLDEVVGFGQDATGGADGCVVRVTSLKDEGEGTLREATSLPGPAWIVFDVSGVIEVDDYIEVTRDKTVDGRGAKIAIDGAGFLIAETPNVIVNDLEVRNAWQDAFQVRGEDTTDIWIHHVLVWDIEDGYVDITQGATNVTVSWAEFRKSPDRDRDKVVLVGTGEEGYDDARSLVTLHHNYFRGTQQRNPLIRGGFVHSFNNYFAGWGLYASGVDDGGRLLSEGNVYAYDGTHRGRAFLEWGAGPAYIRSVDDVFLDGASGVESNPDDVPSPPYVYELDQAGTALAERVMGWTGPRG